jgi:hypothetical protein
MVTVVDAKPPVGARLNNPLNIKRTSINWAGKSAVQAHAVFETFDSPHYGIRAAARNLLTYYRRDRLNTIQEIVNRWAPPDDDNNTAAYIDFVAKQMDVQPDTELNLEDPEVLGALVLAMMAMEIGPGWAANYGLATIKTAVAAAYVGGAPGSPVVQPQPDYVSPMPPEPTPVVTTSPTKPPLVDQPSAAPTNKVTAGSIGAMGGLPVAFVAKVFWDRYVPEQPMPTEIAIAIAAAASSLLSFVIGYYTRNRATPCPPPAAQV